MGKWAFTCLLCSGWLNPIFIGSFTQVWRICCLHFIDGDLVFHLSCVIWESPITSGRSQIQTHSCPNSKIHLFPITRWPPTLFLVYSCPQLLGWCNCKEELSLKISCMRPLSAEWLRTRIWTGTRLQRMSEWCFLHGYQFQQIGGLPVITPPSLYVVETLTLKNLPNAFHKVMTDTVLFQAFMSHS